MTMTQADLDAQTAVHPRSDLPKRRFFSAEYKARILAEHAAAGHGERGALLRREGLYTSHITQWRRAAEGNSVSEWGRKMDKRDKEIAELTKRAEKAESELARTKAALELMGKAHALLETLSKSADNEQP
ncbi:MAG: hypothetical protein FWG25_10875 [Promicromonosporaceae bacterium]|nr:hypothetical protein [Promicromonosporaceae bacterium]